MALVYALIDSSNPDEMRYIGKTTQKLKERFKCHLRNAPRDQSNRHVYNWMRRDLKAGKTLDIIVIEDNLTDAESLQREIYYIDYYKALGHRLTNMTDGGEGMSGYAMTDEHKRKLSKAHTGKVHSEETKQRISQAKSNPSQELRDRLSEANKGHVPSEEARRNMSKAGKGRVVSEETRRKISIINSGRIHTAQSRLNMSMARTGLRLTEEAKELARLKKQRKNNQSSS